MDKIRNKMKKQGGFTLIEMLIVVAIIAILVAVSIPVVSSALERARQATDAANERAAKAEASILYLTEDDILGDLSTDVILHYDATTGKLGNDTSIDGYGKCATMNHNGAHITATIKKDGTITIAWTGGDGGTTAHNSSVNNG